MELLFKNFIVNQTTEKINSRSTTVQNNLSINVKQSKSSKFRQKKQQKNMRSKTKGQQQSDKENEQINKYSLRKSITKNGFNIEDSYNCYNYYQNAVKNPANKQQNIGSFSRSCTSKFYKNRMNGQIGRKICQNGNSLQNNSFGETFFKKSNKLTRTVNTQIQENWRDNKSYESYFWFDNRNNQKKSPVKQILKYNDRQRKLFLRELTNNRLSCVQLEIQFQKQPTQKEQKFVIRQSKVQRMNTKTQPCDQIEQKESQTLSNARHSKQLSKQNFHLSVDSQMKGQTLEIQKSHINAITRLSNYSNKSSIMNLNVRSSAFGAPKYRISKAQKQKINDIVRNSMVSCQIPCHSARVSKAALRQTQFLKKVFDNKIKQLIKMKKKGSIQDQSYQEQTIKVVQAFCGTLQGDKHEENQDAIEYSDSIYIVCDGHGSNGKKISSFISQSLHKLAKQRLVFGDNQINQKVLTQIFKLTEQQLDESGLDITFSGTTVVMVVKDGQNLFCASVGDSRAILSTNHKTLAISAQHKPCFQKQRNRIQACGGVIRQTQISHNKFAGPMRVWAPGKISWGPGLALSRAFGDKASRKYGVISQPQILTFKLTFDQDFIVLGSDGLFDVMSDQQISSSVKKFLKDQHIGKQYICQQLIQMARQKWKQDSDDISCILVLF